MEQTFIPETLEHLVGAIEALLFVSVEPLPEDELARLTGWDIHHIRAALELLDEQLTAAARGVALLRVSGGYQLATKPMFSSVIARLSAPKPPPPLSRAALETLAIIAYKQPITRTEIDYLRGVRSDSAIHSLQERELIEEAARAEAPGRPILYRTTERFLHWCALNSLDDLPPLPDAELPADLAAELPADMTAERPTDIASEQPAETAEPLADIAAEQPTDIAAEQPARSAAGPTGDSTTGTSPDSSANPGGEPAGSRGEAVADSSTGASADSSAV